MKPPKVLITAPTLASAGLDIFRKAGYETAFFKSGSVQDLIETVALEEVDAILCRGVCSRAVIASAPRLKVISRHGVGYDSVDIEAATERRIPVMIAAGANAQSVAELALGMMLALGRKFEEHTSQIRSGLWIREGAGLQLSSKTLGIVGLGTIGSKVARLAQAFGMRVIAYDIQDKTGAVHEVEISESLDALLRESDVVSLHVPRTPATANMLASAELARMKAGAVLINTARGEVVNEQDLHVALASGHLWGAGLDVHHVEKPQANNPLRQLRNVILTPHIGAQTDISLQQVAAAAAKNIVDVLEGRSLSVEHCVNYQALKVLKPAA